MLVAVLMALTLAPATGNPIGSVTVPDMLPPRLAQTGIRHDIARKNNAARLPKPIDLLQTDACTNLSSDGEASIQLRRESGSRQSYRVPPPSMPREASDIKRQGAGKVLVLREILLICEPQRELDLPRRLRRKDFAEGERLVGKRVRQIEIGAIEHVEGLRFGGESGPFAQVKNTPQRKIDGCQAGSAQDIPPGVTPRILERDGEGRRVKPLLRRGI